MRRRLLSLTAVPVFFVGVAACGNSSDDTASDPAAKTPSQTSSDSASAPSTEGPCTYSSDGQKAARPVDLPSSTPKYTEPVDVTIETSAGTLHGSLAGDTAPCTVNSFASLAEQGFYDQTPCPRITTNPGFQLLQCGDPTGTTGGGPGYRFDDELTGSETYPAGTLAMANSGADTNGSQFFIVYGNTRLAPSYTVFGTIDDASLEVVAKIGADGDDGSNPAGGGAPNTPIDINKVTVGG